MLSVNYWFHSNQPNLSIPSPRTAKKLISCNKTWRSHRQDAFRLQEQHSFPISFLLTPKAHVVHSGTRSPHRNGECESEQGVRVITRNGFVPFSRFVPL
ncbi:hypothetical protein AVEN_215102-1 [Araneus ventricosus]|uniref:Uncharacterized protein n=1 Tax=Araneus ventricosus TaxID=182803 RepID=A0A4Y2KBA0_ARAVE|nr:hypothetical protein AVEN_215102-1 [Araneus ventricosus]